MRAVERLQIFDSGSEARVELEAIAATGDIRVFIGEHGRLTRRRSSALATCEISLSVGAAT